MQGHDRSRSTVDRAASHAVDLAVGLLTVMWLAYVLRITRGFSFWSDDLFLLDQAGSWRGLFEPYNDHMSLVILAIYRACAELGGFRYTPFMVAGALSLVAAPVAYYVTTRGHLGSLLAGLFATTLLWYRGMDVRPYGLNHYLALVGGILCAAALNRGRRADGLLAGSLAFSLFSAGGGVVVAIACVLHNLLTRPPMRRWLAVLIPFALWGCWWLIVARATALSSGYPIGLSDSLRVVRDLCLSPFYAASLGNRPGAWLLMCAFAAYGVRQVQRGADPSANFIAWTAAMGIWAIALVRSRGLLADPGQFRYAFLSLGFALLALVPRAPTGAGPTSTARAGRRHAALLAVAVLAVGLLRGATARGDLQRFAGGHDERGREARGTMLVLDLGPTVIPDDAPMSFYGIFATHGSAAQVRSMVARYGSPSHTSVERIDRDLVDLGIARVRIARPVPEPRACRVLASPLSVSGIPDHGQTPFGSPAMPGAGDRAPLELWSRSASTVDVRRFGGDWVNVATVPEGHKVILTLPTLNSDRPWQIRANGSCEIITSGVGS
jgi:hypothetical protein